MPVRASASLDLLGTGKTALKFAAGRYYYQVPSTLANNVNANGSYSEQWTWNDANGDLHFQPGEQTGTRAITAVFDPTTGELLTRFDEDFRRSYTNELALSVDHELISNLRLAVGFGYRTERNPQASFNPDNIFSSVPSYRVDPGIDGITGTADDGTFFFSIGSSAGSRGSRTPVILMFELSCRPLRPGTVARQGGWALDDNSCEIESAEHVFQACAFNHSAISPL